LGGSFINGSGALRRGGVNVCLDVIASEAKQSILSYCGAMDCFAALAMTGEGCFMPPLTLLVIARSGATKQSILSLRGLMDCFAALAMTVRLFDEN
jgi:hypothetical protein